MEVQAQQTQRVQQPVETPSVVPAPQTGSGGAAGNVINLFNRPQPGTQTVETAGFQQTTTPQAPTGAVQGVPLAQPAGQPAAPAQAPGAAQAPTRLYILQSGWNDPQRGAADGFRQELIERGVNPDHIITLDTPYSMTFNQDHLRQLHEHIYGTTENPHDEDTVRARQLGFFFNRNSNPQYRQWNESYQAFQQSSRIFRDSANPESRTAQNLYRQYDQALQARLTQLGLNANQVELVGIGHSAGGQILSTIAGMSQDNNGPQFHTIETMGSPFLRSNAPESVRMVYNVSEGDEVCQRCEEVGPQVGLAVQRIPEQRDQNDQVHDIPNIGHSMWYSNDQVFDRVAFQDLGIRNQQFNQWVGRTVGNAFMSAFSGFPVPLAQPAQ